MNWNEAISNFIEERAAVADTRHSRALEHNLNEIISEKFKGDIDNYFRSLVSNYEKKRLCLGKKSKHKLWQKHDTAHDYDDDDDVDEKKKRQLQKTKQTKTLRHLLEAKTILFSSALMMAGITKC